MKTVALATVTDLLLVTASGSGSQSLTTSSPRNVSGQWQFITALNFFS
jgi:hypothetical protein